MAFLNLGSFGEGFVTGFATEANKSLKDSINRINTRVDKLKDFQVQRAIKDQDKRRAEIEENKKALERAYAVLGGDADAERAIAYAGGLLKERGSVAAFNKRIDELQAAKDSGYDIMSYFDRASFDAPAGTLDDYAIAAAGAPQTFATDYRIPEGMDTGTGRTLVGTILGKDIDIVGRAMQEAGEEVRALYGADVTTLAQLPTITFKAEEFSLRDKTPAERLEYANKKLALPNVQKDDALREKYITMRDEQEAAVVKTKDEAATLQVIDAQLNRVEKGSDEEKTLLAQRKTVNRNMQLKAASDQPVKTLNLKIEYALADALDESERTGNPPDRTEVDRLENELATLTDQVPTVQSEIDEDMEDLRRRSAPDYTGADKITVGSPEYEKTLAKIKVRQDAHDATAPDKPLNPKVVNVYQDMLEAAIVREEAEAIKQFSPEDRVVYEEIKNQAGGPAFKPAALARLRKKGQADAAAGNNSLNERLAIYDKVSGSANSVKDAVIARTLNNYNKNDHPEAWVAASQLGYIDPDTTSGDTPSSDASAQTAATLGGAEGTATAEDVKEQFPDTVEGANAMINQLYKNKLPVEDAIKMAKEDGYSQEFLAILEQERGQDPAGVAQLAIEDAGMEINSGPDKMQMAVAAVQDLPFLAGKISKINAIMSATGATKPEANAMLKDVEAAVAEQRKDGREVSPKKATPVQLARQMRKAKTLAEYEDALSLYLKATGREEEDVRVSFPAPRQSKNRGGLMARK
jgi:hypothetical protein